MHRLVVHLKSTWQWFEATDGFKQIKMEGFSLHKERCCAIIAEKYDRSFRDRSYNLLFYLRPTPNFFNPPAQSDK